MQYNRVNAYIKNGWDKQLVDPDCHKKKCTERSTTLAPTDGWQDLTEVYGNSTKQSFGFAHAQLLGYFVTRIAHDGLPAGDFKSVYSSALNLFRCGHVQKIQVCHEITSDSIFIRADCLPEMKKDRIYKIELQLEESNFEISAAQCGCPAGRGPRASCKHIAALCYALEEFEKVTRIPEFQTCTDKLQTWNQPRPRKLDPIPVESLRIRKQEIVPPRKWSAQLTRVSSEFDTRPESFRTHNPNASEQLRCSLLALNKPCAFLHILVPDIKKVWHDHSYSRHPYPVEALPPVNISSEPNTTPTYTARTLDVDTIITFKDSLRVSSSDRCRIEADTRQQSSSKEWFSVRARRITSSICGRILIQHKKTLPLLLQCLYPKPMFDPLPAALAWGRQNESVACRKYQEYMIEHGHKGHTTHPCCFIIHPTKGWLGASPDAQVVDPSCNLVGIAEFKCPYAKRDQSPYDACTDANFYGELVDGKFQLKRRHIYFHQVQLQLYVSSDQYSFCDFCVYTPIDVAVEWIHLSKEWEVAKLEDYFDKHMLPEIIDPMYKPSYIL